MLVGEFIGLVMLRVNGGKTTADSSVLPSDIRAYLPAANNLALDITYNNNMRSEGTPSLPTQMYSFFRLPVNNDTRPYLVNIPVKIASLKGDYGTGPVVDDAGNMYAPVPNIGVANFNYYSQTAPGIKWYRHRGNMLQIFTDNPLLSHIEIQCLVDVSELKDEDELPVQAGMEKLILDIMVEWFTGQKQMPYDTDNDGQDINATP